MVMSMANSFRRLFCRLKRRLVGSHDGKMAAEYRAASEDLNTATQALTKDLQRLHRRPPDPLYDLMRDLHRKR